MKIAIIMPGNSPLPPTLGGAVENLTSMLIDENEKNGELDIVLFSAYEPAAEKLSREYRHTKFKYIKTSGFIYFVKNSIFYLLNRIRGTYGGNLFIRQVVGELKKAPKFDAIIVENVPLYMPLLKGISGKKILHLHNDYIKKDMWEGEKIEKSTDALLAVSSFIAESSQSLFNPEKIKVLNNAVDLQKFNSRRSESAKSIKEKLGIKDGEFVVGFFGRVIKEKGVKELISAFRTICDKIPAKLLIVGGSGFAKSKEKNFYKTLRDSAKDNKNIIWTGFIDYKNLKDYYQISDIVCAPSTCNEAFGMVALEAMGCGCPLIVSDAKGFQDAATPECAITARRGEKLEAEIADAIIALFKNPGLRESMRDAGIEQAKSFSKESYFKNFVKILGGIIAD